MRPLELVDLVGPNDELVDGLVSVHTPAVAATLHERAVLLQAKEFSHVDFVFFRRRGSSSDDAIASSEIAAYVVDNEQHGLSESEIAELHHKLWLHGAAPLVYVAWPTRIDILTCAREPDFWDTSAEVATRRYTPVDRIEPPDDSLTGGVRALKTAASIAEQFARIRKRYSAHRLAEGTFWDDPANRKLARREATAHCLLIQAIVEADRDLKGASHPIRRRLLVLVILIKYLEDRGVFPERLFGRFHAGARSIRDMLSEGTVDEVRRLLAYLENKFNGDVFALGPDADQLTATEFNRFARLAAANEIGGQPHFWELFSFEYIPVEVISRLYQRFVTGRGAVYTPPLLAALLLDRSMPYDQMTGSERVLDPACGSGVFLVGAFNRLVVHWRSRHGWRRPAVNVLKGILAHSIYGVELEAGAVDLTAFSLALAVCDALDPPVIWSSLKFDRLRGGNIREGDFFDPAVTAIRTGNDWPSAFDLVIGNPPFDSAITPVAAKAEAEQSSGRPKLPDNQCAYLFLEKGLMSLAPGGTLCLIQPHGLIYNRKTEAFRSYLMKLCPLHAILDFVSIRGLYDGADPKTIAWQAVRRPADDRPVRHLTFRRTYAAAELISFELDHYDDHAIRRACAEMDPHVWRLGLLGGGRLYDVAGRLQELPTLREMIHRNGWRYGEGFILGNGENPADFLTGRPYLPTKAFTEDGIDEDQIHPLEQLGFECPRSRDLYAPPLVLIKEHASLPVAFWDASVLTYQDKVVGIHAPPAERSQLHAVFKRLTKYKRFYQFFCMIGGSQALVGKATAILKQDIDRLPYPEDVAALELAFWEEALRDDVIDHMADYVRLGQESTLLRDEANPVDIKAYADLFVRMLGSVYRSLKADDAIVMNGLVAQPFYFGAKPDVSWLGDDCAGPLHKLVYDESRHILRTVRVVRYYDGNVILVVKPSRLRYWIRSTAVRDADDTLVELREQGW